MFATTTTIDDEVRTEVTGAGAYEALIARLSKQSVSKHFDAYGDVDWDGPEMQIDADDPRFELPSTDPLAATDWYRNQPPDIRARIGLHRIAGNMKVGLQFESVLQRGILEYAAGLPNGSPEFRYAYHEVVEEGHHSMMFQEFVNRSGIPVRGLPKPMQFASRQVVKLGHVFPELFFTFVLGGEDPIDFVQRSTLRSDKELHPLLERIMRIHVTEEARHLSFARHYLRRQVPKLGWGRRQVLAIGAPIILGTMAALMLRPSPEVVKTYRIPKHVLSEAYADNPESRQYVVDSLRKVRELCVELGLINPVSQAIWRAFRIWG
jgi:hypothetical protein